MANYITIEGELITPSDLEIDSAIDFLNAINNSAYCEFVQCFKKENNEILVFDSEIEHPQFPIHEIESKERVAVLFYPNEENIPRVYALRDNFPYVPHINIYEKEFPRWLCIYEESFHELKLKWSGVTFLEDIRKWFADTAKGQLHANDQALESLLLPSSKILIMPRQFIISSLDQKPIPISLEKITPGDGIEIYFLKPSKYNSEPFALLLLLGKPQKHGLIRKIPSNLFELHEFLKSADIDLLKTLEETLFEWKDDPELKNKGILEASLIILVELPTKRDESSEPERFEQYAYAIHEKIKVIGEKIGIWELSSGQVGILIGGKDQSKNGSDLIGELLNPIYSYDKIIARNTSDITIDRDLIITAIGLGAIGSQIFMNLIRMGIGNWNLIDKDIVLPHNIARSDFLNSDVGFYKTDKLSKKANEIYGIEYVRPIKADVLNPKTETDLVNAAFLYSNVILDMSASVPVARKISLDVNSKAKRISVFLSPSGNDSVLLSEDENREINLDFLEMIYYRFVSKEEELEEHLSRPTERIRFGNSCRDVSFKLPQDIVAIHSGILSRAIRDAINSKEAQIRIWKTHLGSIISIKEFSCPIPKAYRSKSDEWSVVIDDYLLDKLSSLRKKKLPNETGGILIGSYDKLRKICYLVDTIPSPSDSVEWPTVYIRGCQGLENKIHKISEITDNNLEYIGEWHSHPIGSSSLPSSDDFKAFSWLTEVMLDYGLPALMIIVSDENSIYIGKMINKKQL